MLEPAGHILGSSIVVVDVGGRTVVFSGDLGRPHHPLLVPPHVPPACDALVIESTYGDRRHEPVGLDALAALIMRTLDRDGTVVIPAFAVDRTEVILIALRRLTAEGRIPRVPVFVDSPMALGALQIYQRALREGDPDVLTDLEPEDLALDPGLLHEVRSPEESRALSASERPCIIDAASGMATGGRVVHHLRHLLPDRRNSVALVGYQAEGTRGRALADGATEVKIHGMYVPVLAEIADVGSFSVHADADELLAWVASGPQPPKAVYIVHGEPTASSALAGRLDSELGLLAVVARDGEKAALGRAACGRVGGRTGGSRLWAPPRGVA